MQFADLGLSPDVLRAVTDAGYVTPTPIQEQAIPLILTGRDVLGCAQTGTGKTASFTLPMIDILARGRAKARMPRSLILEPTRELATQVAENFDIYGKYNRLTKALLIGGVAYDDQLRLLDRGVDVLIATPGRLLDHFERGKLLLNDVKILVVDEGDRMLDMGFIPDVERIIGLLPKIRQTLFFSATIQSEIRRLADAFLINPKEIYVTPTATTAEKIVQRLAVVPDAQKREALRRLLRAETVKNALIFCNRKRDVDILFRSLVRHGFQAAALHGDLAQDQRQETLDKFKRGEIQLLVCSDVAARGLDIEDLSHVFNFDVPFNAEDYVHRIGRTGRAGKEGHAITLATPAEGRQVAAIAKLIGKEIPREDVPDLEAGALSLDEEPDGGGRRGRGGPRGGRGGRGGGRGSRGGERHGGAPHRAPAPISAPAPTPMPMPIPAPVAEMPVALQPPADAIEQPFEQREALPSPPQEPREPRHAQRHEHRHERHPRAEQPRADHSRPEQPRQEPPRQDQPRHRDRHRPEHPRQGREHREDRDDTPQVAYGQAEDCPAFLLRPTRRHTGA